MAKKKPADGADDVPKEDRSNRKSAPIQVDKDLAKMAAVISTYRGITQAELCSPMIRKALTAEYRLFQEEVAKNLQEEKGGG